jgi:hypothetical protein
MNGIVQRYGRSVIYLLIEKVGFVASLLAAFLFIFGPILWNQDKIPHTFTAGTILIVSIFVFGGVGTGLFLLYQHLGVRWKNKLEGE